MPTVPAWANVSLVSLAHGLHIQIEMPLRLTTALALLELQS